MLYDWTILRKPGSWVASKGDGGGHLRKSVAKLEILFCMSSILKLLYDMRAIKMRIEQFLQIFASECSYIKPTLIFTKDLQLTNLIFAKKFIVKGGLGKLFMASRYIGT